VLPPLLLLLLIDNYSVWPASRDHARRSALQRRLAPL